MTSEIDEIRSNLSNLPDRELRRIANAPPSEYRREAIDFAREELKRRGVPWSVEVKHHSLTAPSSHRMWHKLFGRATTDWRHLSRRSARTLTLPLAALLFLVVVYQNPVLSHGKSGVYMLTAALDLFTLSYLDVFREWKGQKGTEKIRAVGVALIAIFFTVWSILCLVGTISYGQGAT